MKQEVQTVGTLTFFTGRRTPAPRLPGLPCLCWHASSQVACQWSSWQSTDAVPEGAGGGAWAD
eukprot:356781-Chlamydomonas_euryale.AAC.5